MMSSRPRLASIGFDVVATVGGGALAGYWFDRHYKRAPWGLLIGSVLGLLVGLYNLIREALRASRGAVAESAPEAPDPADAGSQGGDSERR